MLLPRVQCLFILVPVLGLFGCNGSSKPASVPDPAPSPPVKLETLTVDLANGVKMEFVLIPKGKFTMGSPAGEKDRETNESQHEVEITKPFYLAKYPMTQEQHEAIMGKNPSYFSASRGGKAEVAGLDTKQFPVETVSWNEAAECCEKLKTSDPQKRSFRLPTEAEWEYACRAGTKTAYYFGDDPKNLGDYAWFTGNSGGRSHAVGDKKPNEWGLYDMQGNVWQWCEDWYGVYPTGAVTDPQGPTTGSYHVHRGGIDPEGCRSAFRGRVQVGPTVLSLNVGFRVAVSVR